MGESLFIEPIRRWLSSRSRKNSTTEAESIVELTPEQQFARLRGLPIDAPEPSVTAAPATSDALPDRGQPQNPAQGNPIICQQCGQACAQDAKFCPICAIPLGTQPSIPTSSHIMLESETQCIRCGQACPEGYELCASCTRSEQQSLDETDGALPVIKRVSIGDGDSESSDDSETSATVVQRVSSTWEPSDDSESPNVNMAESLRSIFSGKTSINPDTVAFLERYGTVGTQELLDELRSLHRMVRQ